MIFRVWIPRLPPSSNNIYIRHPAGKGRVLSPQARTFKLKAMQAIQDGAKVALLKLEKNVPYELHLAVFFEQVENKASTKGNRYKQMDLSNRIKLIEDTVASAIGLDDCHNFRTSQEKHCDPEHPGLYVTLSRVPEAEVGMTKEAYDRVRLQQPERDRASRAGATSRLLGRSPWVRKGASH